MSKTEDLCLAIATEAHKGQVDKAGADYIEHPKRVASRLTDERQRCAALLHDVLEDTPTTADDLLAQGVPADVMVVVVERLRAGGPRRQRSRRVHQHVSREPSP